jgi:hypothetical protein
MTMTREVSVTATNNESGGTPAETGWLPDTPIDDNLLRQFLHNQAEVCDLIAEGFAGTVARTPEVALAASRCVVRFFNEALLLRPLRDDADGVLGEIDRFFAVSESPRWVLLSAWPTPWLGGRGWGLVGHPTFVVRTPGAPLRPPAARPGVAVAVRRAITADDVATAERIFVDGYPLEEGAGRQDATLPSSLADTDISVRIASVDGVDVAVGMGRVAHGCVNLCGAATLPTARRSGAWGALVRARVLDAADLPAVAFTSDYSRPGFEHVGFVSMLRFTMWTQARADHPA